MDDPRGSYERADGRAAVRFISAPGTRSRAGAAHRLIGPAEGLREQAEGVTGLRCHLGRNSR